MKNSNNNWTITATPPTPNGDLHVGHLSGPYLAADVFRRLRQVHGETASYICYGDDNQSYVETTAVRLDISPGSLSARANSDIKKTLSAFDIDLHYEIPGVEHTKQVQDGFHALYDAGKLLEKTKPEPYDSETGVMLFESYLSGHCSHCLRSTKCGICESCGHPNKSDTLLNPSAEDNSTLAFKNEKKLILAVEPYRKQLTEFFESKKGIWRPHILELADQLLSQPLEEIDISFRSQWGMPVGINGWESHIYNVWAEMGLGLCAMADRNCPNWLNGSMAQFLGYDNSYFFLIVHPTLHYALSSIDYPVTKLTDYIYTNEFYNLDGKKFSTSQGHVIWGRDLLLHMSSDQARYYLTKNGPELAESNFVLAEAKQVIETELKTPIEKISKNLADIEDTLTFNNSDSNVPEQLQGMVKRYNYYSKPQNFSASKLSRITGEFLEYLAYEWPSSFNDASEYVVSIQLLAKLAEPIMPRLSENISQCFVDKGRFCTAQLSCSLTEQLNNLSVNDNMQIE